MTLSTATTQKALRFRRDGRVREVAAPRVFFVEGDHGRYTVVIANGEISCSCRAAVPCSHVAAAGLEIAEAR